MIAAQAVRDQTNTARVTRAGLCLRMCVWVVDQRTGEPLNVDLTEHGALAWLNITKRRL